MVEQRHPGNSWKVPNVLQRTLESLYNFSCEGKRWMRRPTPVFLMQVTALTHEPPSKRDVRRKYTKIAIPY